MNYLEAVKELVNNPKAVAICFNSKKSGRKLSVSLVSDGKNANLVFKSGEKLGACNPEFILREDFSIEYKVDNIYDKISAASGVARADVKKVIHTVNYMAEDTPDNAYRKGFQQGYNAGAQDAKQREEAAFEKFKAGWRNLIGE